MRFRLFGVPVTVQTWFWISTLFLGFASGLRDGWWVTLPIWVAVVFVSILVHELGHAFAIMRHGVPAAITLHGMGGVTTWGAPRRVGRLDRAIISLAGPFAGFVFGGLVYAVSRFLHAPPPVVGLALAYLLWVNIGWGLVNLAPVLPFDGGHVLEEALGPRRARTAALVSLVAAVALTAYFIFGERSAWGAILFGMAALQSWQLWQLPPGAVLVDPFTQPSGQGWSGPGSSSSGGPGPLRRWWLKLRLRRLQSQADAMREQAPRRRSGGPDLRVIEGGRSEPPKDKRYLN